MNGLRAARRFAIGFFAVYVLAVIYPGAALFRGPRPYLFGMPLAMVWTAAWVVAAFFVLVFLGRAYDAVERTHDGGHLPQPPER
jgi:hypothetical protein